MDRITLVELIEAYKAKLSPEALELWEELDTSLYLSPEEEPWLKPHEVATIDRLALLAESDRNTIDLLTELRAGLYDSDHAERQGESGEERRNGGVIRAALLKDRDEISRGKPVRMDLDRTVEQAIARLTEEGDVGG